MSIRAAGILYVAPNGHVLLCKRTDGQGWAFPGGGIEDGESAEDAARREFQEETGRKAPQKLTLWTRRIQNECDFSTFLAQGAEFSPELNDEHSSYQWLDCDFALAALPLLHPGVAISLARFGMDELGIAKAMAAGELTSPQRYGNMLLIAIRITGTGVSYRSNGDEFVMRTPALYMNEEFLQRCNGLAVIEEHPEELMLDTKEFRKRIVGTVFLPYLKPEVNEVWGIAKILDMEAAEMLEDEKMSTSPCAVFRSGEEGIKHTLRDGSTLLVEGKPILLDHVAICPLGVWDKGGPAAGVDSVDTRPEEPDALDALIKTMKIDEAVRLMNRMH